MVTTPVYAVCLSDDSKTKQFQTLSEAIAHVESYCCETCKRDAQLGYYDDDGQRWSVDDIFDTSCGAEWAINTTEPEDFREAVENHAKAMEVLTPKA